MKPQVGLTHHDSELIRCLAMKSSILLFLCAFVAAAEPTSGKVIVLDNDLTLEGDISLDGEQYIIRGAVGTTTIPVDRVRKVCADKKEALGYLREKTNPEDPDDRLKLARWCHVHGLREEALEEVKAALAIRPQHAESKQLLRYFEQWARHDAENKKSPKRAETEAAKKPAAPAVSITADSMSVFVGRVQPILMNACARCHSSSDNTSGFRLERSHGIGVANRRAVQENLAAVLAQLHTTQAEHSPLLIKALSAHGLTTDAPLRSREIPAYRTLEDWVRLTLANNPQLQDVIKPPPVLTPAPSAATPAVSREVPKAAPASETAPARTVPVTASPTKPVAEAAEDQPESEFDPLIFNRQMHPAGPPAAPPHKDRE
jgi:hypothetical protein